jgi:transposase
MGRPSSYDATYHIPQAELLCRLGATIDQLAEAFGVSGETVRRWMLKYPDFCGSIRVGATPADDRVEMTLYRRATGYQTVETENTYEMAEVTDPVSGEVRVFRKLTAVKEKVREVPPDVTAITFWLKNRRPAEWRENYTHTVVDPDEVSSEQLAKQLMFTFRQYAEEGGDPAKLLEEKTRPKRDE